jgi:hypothetical protein
MVVLTHQSRQRPAHGWMVVGDENPNTWITAGALSEVCWSAEELLAGHTEAFIGTPSVGVERSGRSTL